MQRERRAEYRVTPLLCDLRQTTALICASFSLAVKQKILAFPCKALWNLIYSCCENILSSLCERQSMEIGYRLIFFSILKGRRNKLEKMLYSFIFWRPGSPLGWWLFSHFSPCRYYAICCQPLVYRNKMTPLRIAVMLGGCWVIPTFISFLPIMQGWNSIGIIDLVSS